MDEMETAWRRWLRRSRDFTAGDVALARAAWESAWADCLRDGRPPWATWMTDEQYAEFLEDLQRLRRALDLPDGALPISPREAFRECVEAAMAEGAIAARQDERRAIAAWLRATDRPRLADRVDRGDHLAGSPDGVSA